MGPILYSGARGVQMKDTEAWGIVKAEGGSSTHGVCLSLQTYAILLQVLSYQGDMKESSPPPFPPPCDGTEQGAQGLFIAK